MRLIFVILICFSGPVLSKYYEKTRFDRSVYGYSESPTVNGLAIRKRWTFTDDQTNYRAYRDRTENSCYLEKLGENVVAEEYPDIKFQPNRMTRTFYVSEDVLTKLEAWRLAGGRIVDFCQGRKIILLQTTVPVPEKAIDPFFNILPYDENDIASKRVADVLLTPLINRAKRQIQLEKREEINKSFNRLRSTRQTQHPRGKFRGQTQSQYLNIGNDDKKEGKAEAEATQQSSRSVVSGSRGMGQAQSMSFGSTGCEDCAKYTGEGPPDRYIQYPSTGPGTTYSRTSLPKHDGTSYPQDLAPGTLIKDGRPYTGGVTYPGGVPGTAGGVTYPGGVPGTTGGVIYPGRVPGTTGGVVYPGGVPGTAPGGGGVLHPGGAPGGKVLPPGHVPSTTSGGGAVYPGGIPGGIPGSTTGGGVVYPGGTPGTPTTGSGGTYPGGVPGTPTTAGGGIYPGGVPGTPTTGGGGTYPGGVPGTSITGGGIYPGGIPGTTTGGGGTYPGGMPGYGSGTYTGGGGTYPGGVPGTSGGTYTGGGGAYPGGVPGTGGGGTYPGGLPGTPTTGGGGTYHSGVPGTATAGGGVTYPGGVPGTRIDGGTVYPGGVPGTSTSGGGVTYPGGVPGTRIDGGTVYPGGVPGTTTGGGTTYPAGVPGTTTGGGVAYPGGVPGTATGGGVIYPGGIPGTTTGGGVIYPGGVPGTTTGGGVIYPGGVPGTTTGGGVIYPGGVPSSRVSYPGGIPGTTTSGGVTYPGGIPGTTIAGDARVYVGTMPSTRTGGGEVPYPGGIPGGGVIYPGGVPDITTSGGVIYPGGAPGTATGTGVNYPGSIPGTTTGGVVYPGGIPGTSGGGVVYPGGIPGTTTGGGVVYPSGIPGITSNGNVIYPGGTAPGSKDTTHGQISQTNGQIPGGTATGPGAANLYRETSTGTSRHTDSQGTVPGYPQQGQYPGYPQQGQYPGYPQPGQYPGYPQGQYPGTVTWQTGEKPVDQYTIDGQNIRQQYPGSQYPSKPGPATGETSQYFQQPGAVPSAEDDNSDSQASSIVKQTDAGTQASASAQGKYGQGTSQSQVTGTYSGSGSFSAQAGSTDNNKSAQTEISGGKEGATSNAQGTGGYGKSQAQVQLDSESGATSTGAQSSGWNHGTNSQVQASSKGGMADAQANGEGSTSSQAQIGFQPYMKTDEKVERHSRPFRGGGTASAQSGTHRGQSQSQLEGSFQYGITYTGAAQAGSGSGAAASRKPFSFNLTDTELFKPFKPSYIPHITKNSSDATNASSEVDYEYDQDKFQQGLQASSSSQKAVFVKQSTNENSKNVDIKQTQLDDTAYDYEEEYDGDEDDGGEQNNNNHQSQAVHLATGNQYDIHIKQDANTAQVGDTFHPGQSVSGYTIPPGFRGRVTSVSGSETVAHGDGKSQSQSVSLVPIEPNTSHGNKSPVSETRSLKTNRGRLIEDHVPSNEKQKDHFSQAPSRQSTMENSKPTASMPMKPSYYTVTNSVAGKMDDSKSSPRKYEHRYYTKSSTCGYFTFSCNVVYGSNGRTKICKPKMPTYPDGTPMKC